MEWSTLPGYEIVEPGLRDLRAGEETRASLLVSMAVTRLRTIGLDVPAPLRNPEEKFYALLAAEHGDGAHSKYNACRRRLVSFMRAAECAMPSTPSASENSLSDVARERQ